MTIATILAARDADVVTVDAQTPLLRAALLLAERKIGALPVIEHGKVIGVFSERDLIYALGRHGRDALELKVGETMTAPAITVSPENSVLAALSLMSRRRVRHLPVVAGESGQLIGFVSIGDLVKYRIDRIESEAAAMRDYIQGA